jgi:hypothetical protein
MELSERYLKKQCAHREMQQILATVISISEETVAAVVQNFQHQLQVVLNSDDAHTENVFM